MGYSEFDGRIVFTYKIKQGPSQKSYGIEVARLAGLPAIVIENAKSVQSDEANPHLEFEELSTSNKTHQAAVPVERQLEFNIETRKERVASQRVMDELALVNPSEMTPLEALTKIAKWQDSYL